MYALCTLMKVLKVLLLSIVSPCQSQVCMTVLIMAALPGLFVLMALNKSLMVLLL